MPVITYDDFSLGKDLRKGISVADANRLRELKNGYVTTGKVVKKRPGTTKVATLETGTKGIVPGLGKLHTFTESGTLTHANALFVPHQVVGSNVNPAVFVGGGLNDLTSSGGYTGTGTPTYTIEIDGKTTGSITKYEELNTSAITAMANAHTGAITVMADAGGGNTTITSATHGLANEDRVTISATSNYNGIFTIASVTTNTFQIVRTFVSDEATGAWGGNTTVTSAAHGLSNGTIVSITVTTNYNGTYTIEDVATNTFNIVKEFTTNDAAGKWELSPNPSSGTTTVTDASHGLVGGNEINIIGTTNYNGTYTIADVTTNTFVITKDFVADDATGTWEKIPNTFRWKKDSGGYTSGVSITGSAQLLGEGVEVNFAARFGHTLTNYWTVGIAAAVTVAKIHFGDVFNGYLYVSIEYSNATVLHHYLDGATPTKIADSNCPNTKGLVKLSQKIWAINGDKVRFSATGNPRDWTTGSDAGYLSVGLRQKGSDTSLALGQYKEGNLVVFFRDGAQLWNVDPDPALHTFAQSLLGSQSQHHRAIALLFQDLYFLSDFGFRSIAESVLTESQAELDVGSPIDSVIQGITVSSTERPTAIFNPALGQYMCAIESTIYVFTFSKTAKITAWSEYLMPWAVDDISVLDSVVYLRNGDNVYKLDDSVYRDNVETGKAITAMANNGSGGTTITSAAHGRVLNDWVDIIGTTSYNGSFQISAITTNTFDIATVYVANDATGTYTAGTEFEFQMDMAFVDAKKPGVLKMWRGVDTVTTGGGRLSFRFDPRDLDFVTDEITLTGDTRPGEMTPVEIGSANISPLFKNKANEAFQLDALSLYFENLVPL